jgi:hypothetical protein
MTSPELLPMREIVAKEIWLKRPDCGHKPWPFDVMTAKERRGYDHNPIANVDLCLIYADAAIAALTRAPSTVGVSRREKLEDERNVLDNSFGHGSFKDGQTRQRIEEIDRELATLASEKEGGKSETVGAWEPTVQLWHLRNTVQDAIEALERNSTSAPVVECLKAALAASPASLIAKGEGK